MTIEQPNSALARAERAVLLAKQHLCFGTGSIEDADKALDLALGALGFAGNSQTRLIDALQAALTTQGHSLKSTVIEQGFDAINHATGPGID